MTLKEFMANPYLIILAGIVVIGIAYGIGYLFRKRFPSKTQKVTASPVASVVVKPVHAPIDARLYDSTTRTITMATLDGTIADEILKTWHSFGRKWLYEGKWVYAINKYQNRIVDTKSGEISVDERILYRPVESRMAATRENPPSKVHRALNHPEIAIFFDVTDKKTTLEKLMPVLVFAGVGLFILFMWANS